MFEVLKVSSLIKKGLSSTCRVILAWKLALASRKSSSKYWRFVLEFIYISLYGSILRESHNEHNSQTSSTRNTNELLEPQRLQSYIQIQVDIHSFLNFAYVFLILLIVYWIVFCLVSSNVNSTRNIYSKLFQKFLFL